MFGKLLFENRKVRTYQTVPWFKRNGKLFFVFYVCFLFSFFLAASVYIVCISGSRESEFRDGKRAQAAGGDNMVVRPPGRQAGRLTGGSLTHFLVMIR